MICRVFIEAEMMLFCKYAEFNIIWLGLFSNGFLQFFKSFFVKMSPDATCKSDVFHSDKNVFKKNSAYIWLISEFVHLHLQVLIGPLMCVSYTTSQTWCNMLRKLCQWRQNRGNKFWGTKWLINTLLGHD